MVAVPRRTIVTATKGLAILAGIFLLFACASQPSPSSQTERIHQLEQELQKSVSNEIAQGNLDITTQRDVLIVSVSESVLFAPDSAQLRPESLGILRQLADVFKQAPDRIVVIQGNTAVATSSPEALKLYPTSWELAGARAVSVVRFLQEQCSMDPAKLVATSAGEYHPRADNATVEGRTKNRRVDFVLVANALYYGGAY